MRILVISNYYPPLEIGGWEQLTRDVAEALADRGHLVQILTSRHRADEISGTESTIARRLYLESPDHARYHLKNTLHRAKNETQNQTILSESVKKFQPDIIFINGMWNLPVSLALHAETLLPGHVVYYVASYWMTDTDAHRAYWTDIEGRHPLKRALASVLRSVLEKYSARNAPAFAHVLCVSQFMLDHVVEKGGVSPQNARVVHNGIDPNIFVPMTHPAGNHTTLRLLYAGRLSPDKGVHTAIEALGKLLRDDANFAVQLSIVGSGTARYESQLRTLTQDLGLNAHVKFWGQVPRESMPDILGQHDVLLLLSVWAEPLARMTQEAMASGLTVIGTPTGGTPEILFDGENGLIVAPDDAFALAQKIGDLMRNPDLRQKMAKSARHTVEEKFTFSRMVDEIEDYFENEVLE